MESLHIFGMPVVLGSRMMAAFTGARVPSRSMQPSIVAVFAVSKEQSFMITVDEWLSFCQLQ